MRLGVSNLAWATEDTPAAFDRLAALGVDGIEVAPTRIAGWDALGEGEVAAYRRRAEAAGLRVASLQAVFFGQPGAQLLADAASFRAMAEHMRRVAGIAAGLGAGVAVFGAPRNRGRGALAEADAEALAAERLRRLGDVAQEAGLVIGVEPVPARYGADCLLRAEAVRRVVAACGHGAVRTHLDSACAMLAGDSISAEIAATGAGLAHYHAAEPDLGGFGRPACPHAAAGAALRAASYGGWVVVEMREHGGLPAVEAAVRFAQRAYGFTRRAWGLPTAEAKRRFLEHEADR